MFSRDQPPALHRQQPDRQLHAFPPYRPQMAFENNPSMGPVDPSSVDFRAFYPYTPNEVKHRKRTTSAQLKILENIFKRDTKPNATLRTELAAQLDMTARGVQVWFQNRRAKEKIRAGKAVCAGKTATTSQGAKNDTDPSPPTCHSDNTEPPPDSPDVQRSPYQTDLAELGPSSSQESSPLSASPPQLHLITDSSSSSWQNSPLESSDETGIAGQSGEFADSNLYAYRRGSLPANAFVHDSADGLDTLDPLARRRSVDASLHRLASNPYAHLARAKNSLLYGNNYAAHPYSHHHIGRASYPQKHGLTSSMSFNLDARRASMDSRAFRPPLRGAVSPSPSPLSPYHAVRASLPTHNLYAITSRTVSSPIPGPLPSPGFSFGAASTPSMASPSSGDSARNSPDSLCSFPFRGEDQDTEDDGTSGSYDAFSRFGSIASIATSESSINSTYPSEVCAPDHENERRDSTPGHFLGMMSSLGVSEHLGSYRSHEDIASSGIIEQSDDSHVETIPLDYSSPASTVSPGPHLQDAPSSGVPISRSSELAFALQSKQDQTSGNSTIPYTQHPTAKQDVITPQETHSPYFYVQDSNTTQLQATSDTMQLEYISDKYHYETDCNMVASQGHYAVHQYPITADGYIVEGHGLDLQHHDRHHQQHQMDYGHCAPVRTVDVYGSYGDGIDLNSILPDTLQNAEAFVTYS